MALESVIIAGGGMAGFTAARQLRDRGYTGKLTIVDPEGMPYDRPPLSKDYLLAKRDATQILLSAADWFTTHNVQVITAKVVELDVDTPTVTLSDGQQLGADKIILATGGTARRLPIPGGQLPTVLELRTMKDADHLRSKLGDGVRMAIVGAGLIGAEVASSALQLGATVTLIDPVDPPLVPAVGEVLARRLHQMHDQQGVSVVTGVPTDITVNGNGVHTISLQDGETIEADVVLVGIGIVPDTGLAATSGLDTDNGILVDESQRTSHRNVYAIGDTARTRLADGTLLRRAEHWEHAMNTGTTVAAALLGEELPAHGASWFWSDRHGVHVEGVGSMLGEGTQVIREVEGIPVAAFRIDEQGMLAGCAAIDGGLMVRAARRIIDKQKPVNAEQLADPTIDLKKLAR
ncbi:FAD-dependent oxidoreductase [Arthrobacter sp. MYb213]|uniref:NAD(P)/FAD-dependent oxidoreductase n=1 Tax=Arthrobacter sp. MYb213 TaxID=1848595 RepID=UPI000CFB0D5A|nr:FAD-dependent oxidoreductase [Arthrobacter sp. MYb213]PRB68054.1 assimilatory nitrite reductase subunit [Arthrobacter sp. MYb213]